MADHIPEVGSMRDYDQVILALFLELVEKHGPGAESLPFKKADVVRTADRLGLEIRNMPDIVYTYRTGRSPLPEPVLEHGEWAIVGRGKGRYEFIKLERSPYITIPADLAITPILDATPLIVLKYQKSDEQALLARIRYNRLVDIFTGLTSYHLQSHFRTTVKGLGQVEIDDLYIGINTDGEGFVLPVEAKSRDEKLGVVQITQMARFSHEQFPSLRARPIGICVMGDDSLVFVEFNSAIDANEVATERYKRYKLHRE